VALKSLRRQFPKAASLSYLAALAALQTGRYMEAESFVTDSIKAGERLVIRLCANSANARSSNLSSEINGFPGFPPKNVRFDISLPGDSRPLSPQINSERDGQSEVETNN